ncbi:25980_t:CDS:2 [Dentiscutata erythropus]|uniref:25980_t:CDS:1 n=1 Tax=Dentiscutata erythropus TaxID=1348616 RepID=A0A9N9CE32_9GLOM|nr:25980_t:CDS:2 [Dentiscutata erythropus]
MLVEESTPLNDREYSTDEGVVKDPLYKEIVEHGDEEYKPTKEPEEPEEGLYEEKEDEFKGGPSLTEGDVSDDADIDSSRQLVAMSNRKDKALKKLQSYMKKSPEIP